MREVLLTTVKTMETLGIKVPVKGIDGSFGVKEEDK